MDHNSPEIRYPRRRFIRGVLRGVNRVLFSLLTHLEVRGQENLPHGTDIYPWHDDLEL